MGLRVLIPMAVQKAIADAAAIGTNARDMVLRRDPTLTSLTTQQQALATQQDQLETVASTAQSAITTSAQDRADLRTQLNSAQATLAVQAAKIETNNVTCTAHGTLIASLQGSVASLTTTLANLIATLPKISSGSYTMPTQLLSGATQDVLVPLTPAMPDTNYTVTAALVAPTGVLSKAVVDGVLTKAVGGVTVRVRNTLLTSLVTTGAKIEVVAVRTGT